MKLVLAFLLIAGILLIYGEAKAQIITGSNAPVGSGSSTNNIDEIQKELQQLLDQEAKLNMLKQKLLQKLENTQSQESSRQPEAPKRPLQSTSSPAAATSTQATKLQTSNPQRSPLTDKVQFVKSNGPQFSFTEVNVESGGIFIKRNPKS